MKENPLATPSGARSATNARTFGDSSASTDPALNSTPPYRSVVRLPARSDKTAPTMAPSKDSTRTTLTTTSSMRIEKEKEERTKINAAAMILTSDT